MKNNRYKVFGIGLASLLAFSACSDSFLDDKKNYDNVILGDREQRRIEDGTLFTIGATSIILHAPNAE